METLRNDSRVCGQCGTPLPVRVGGGRQAEYCGTACRVKAHRAKAAARAEASQAELAARARTAEAEAASLREQLAAAKAALAAAGAPLAQSAASLAPQATAAVTCMWCADTGRPGFLPDLDDDNVWYPCDHDDPAVVAENRRARELRELQERRSALPELAVAKPSQPRRQPSPASSAPWEAAPQLAEDGPDRWRVELGGEQVGIVERHHGFRETFGRREEYTRWSGHTAGGREVWAGGPPRDLDNAVAMVVGDACAWLRARDRHGRAVSLGKPRTDGSRIVKQGQAQIGEVRENERGWFAATGYGRSRRHVAGADGQTLYFATAKEAGAALAAYAWQAADDFWRGNDPLLKEAAVLREYGPQEAPTGAR